MGPSTVIIVDRHDPRLRYSGNWTPGSTPGESGRAARATETAGSSLTFTFNGTSVAVYGAIDKISRSGPPKSTYCLDGGPVLTFKGTPSDAVQRVLYFNSTSLAATEHTLVITDVTDSATFWLDHISYVPIATNLRRRRAGIDTTTSTPSSSTVSQSVDTLMTSSGIMSDPPSSITFTTPPISSDASPSSVAPPSTSNLSISHTKSIAIAGGIVGGVVLLAIALAVYYLFGHRITHTISPNPSSARRRGTRRRLSIEPGMHSPAFGSSGRSTKSLAPFQFNRGRYQNPATASGSDTSAVDLSTADTGGTSTTADDIEENNVLSQSFIRPLPLLPPPSPGVEMRSSLRPVSSSGSTHSGHGSVRRELPSRPLPSAPPSHLTLELQAGRSRPSTAPQKDSPPAKTTRPQTAPQHDPPPEYEQRR